MTAKELIYVGPDVPDAAPARIKEGLARRSVAAISGTCPCGGTLVMPSRAERRALRRSRARVLTVEFAHEPDCAAVAAELIEYVRERP